MQNEISEKSKFTLKAAMEYASKGDVETWVHLFLSGEGDNVILSEVLKEKKRHWFGPIELAIEYLDRVVGPELHMEYFESEEWWNYNINQVCNRIENNWDMPPLILENRNGTLITRDGNHRLGALQKLKKEKCFVVIWDDNSLENIIRILPNQPN